MPYVKRNNTDNTIIRISGTKTDEIKESLPDDNVEVEQYISNFLSNFDNDADKMKKRRQLELPPVLDLLEYVVNTIKYLKSKGTDVGTDGDKLISMYSETETKIPNNWKEKTK